MKLKTKKPVTGLTLIAPFALGFLGFYLLPFLWSIRFTFTKGAGGNLFVGFRNYVDIFSTAFRSLFLYPLVLPAASVVIVVQAFFSNGGLINQLLGQPGLLGEDWIHSGYAFPILIGLYVWKNCGYNLVLFLAGLSAIPKEYREAAACEGATGWQITRYITLPMLAPTFFFIFIISVINSFKSFREACLLGGSNPDESIYMLQHFMNNNFQNLNYQRLSVAALMIFAVIFALALILF